MNMTSEKTMAMVEWIDSGGRSQVTEVEVLDWTEDGWAMVAHGDGQLIPVYELAGYICLTGAGVVPGFTPHGSSLGHGAVRARLRHRGRKNR